MNCHDKWLEQALRLCTEGEPYLVQASKVLRTVELCLPDIVVLEPVGIVEPLMDREQFPFRVIMGEFVFGPFQPARFYDHDSVETAARKYADRPFPVLAWIWEEYILRYVYNYLLDLLPFQLDLDLVLKLGTVMRDALMSHTWPNRYFQPAETCPVCFELTISNQVRFTTCKHLFCEECALKWVETNNTCPLCRATIFWDF